MKDLKTFAVKVLGMTDDEVAALYDADENVIPEAWATLAEKDKDRLKRIREEHKEELTTKFNEGHAKAKREERAKYETEIKEHFGIDSKAQGVDLIKDVVSAGKEGDVTTHPEYLALEKKLQTEYIPKEDYEVIKGEYNTFKTQVEKDRVFSRVKSDARKIFHSLNPVLPQDKKRAINQENEFLSKLERYHYQVQEDGNHVVLDKEGNKRLQTENMNPITFQDLVKDLTLTYFDVQDQPPAGNSGADNPPSGGGSKTTYKDKAEFMKAYANEGNPAKAAQMYREAKEAGMF